MANSPSFCAFCGANLAESAIYCASCGVKIHGPQMNQLSNSSKIVRYWNWYKLRSKKGKLFYGYLFLANASYIFPLITILFSNPSQGLCTGKFSMRLFLEGIDQSCTPSKGEQLTDQIFKFILFNLSMFLVYFVFNKWKARKSRNDSI
jgi:hypothetical protein